MRSVIFNQKGGVGKSSITCNLAAISAAQGYKTLVVDLDVQGNSSHYLGFDSAQASDNTVADLLKQSAGFFASERKPREFVHETAFENLYLLPSSPALEQIERELETRYKIYKLRDALKKLDAEFDRIYIDTPPNFNFYSKSALIAATQVLIPFDCDSFSRQALYVLLNNVAELREDHNDKLEVGGIIVNQFNSQARLPQSLIDEMKEEGLPLFDSFLPSSVKMKESHSRQKPMVYMMPSHKLSQQFKHLFNEIEGNETEVEEDATEEAMA